MVKIRYEMMIVLKEEFNFTKVNCYMHSAEINVSVTMPDLKIMRRQKMKVQTNLKSILVLFATDTRQQ